MKMNRDQVKGKLKQYAGRVQQDAGKLAGSTEQQFKGFSTQIEGNFQRAYGDAKEIFRNSIKHL
jgi:uncharacterized protein YjbJ (UPF0337 family)